MSLIWLIPYIIFGAVCGQMSNMIAARNRRIKRLEGTLNHICTMAIERNQAEIYCIANGAINEE